jgi:DnaK suppressor protein
MKGTGRRKKADIERQLRERRAEVLGLIEEHEGDHQPVELDQARVGRLSRMDALQGQAMAEATDRRRHQELERIDAALARLAEGDYGFCLECGEAIAEKRLAFDPAAPLCIACASRQEQQSRPDA